MTIVIPYKRSGTDELIYALRSLRNYSHTNVVIIGDKPEKLDLDKITYIKFRQTPNIARNTSEILKLACTLKEVTEDFVFMHDDMYVLQKITKIPVYHRGPYEEVIEKYTRRFANYYIRRMRVTNHYLKTQGIKKPLCYELHVPFVFNKKKLMQLELDERFNKLSLYGNTYKIGGIKKLKDVKVRNKEWLPTGKFASSHDNTFNRNKLGKTLREMFNEKSVYEL